MFKFSNTVDFVSNNQLELAVAIKQLLVHICSGCLPYHVDSICRCSVDVLVPEDGYNIKLFCSDSSNNDILFVSLFFRTKEQQITLAIDDQLFGGYIKSNFPISDIDLMNCAYSIKSASKRIFTVMLGELVKE